MSIESMLEKHVFSAVSKEPSLLLAFPVLCRHCVTSMSVIKKRTHHCDNVCIGLIWCFG
jgi:hypothetical protein